MKIHPIERNDASPEVQRFYDALARQTGSVSTFNKMLAHKPDILRAYNQLFGAVFADGALPVKLKELAYLRTSIYNACAY